MLVGVLGFFVEPGFSPDARGTLIIFDINGLHNVVHLASGALGLALAGSYTGARTYAIGLGIIYTLVFLLGLLGGDTILGLMPVNGPENVLHLLIAVVGLGARFATPAQPAPTTA